jgi:hypothetical protein
MKHMKSWQTLERKSHISAPSTKSKPKLNDSHMGVNTKSIKIYNKDSNTCSLFIAMPTDHAENDYIHIYIY